MRKSFLVAALLAAPAAAQTFPQVPMAQMTPAEEAAHTLWNMRAALNVAALQCQFSPFLRTVKNYNEMLPHHNVELEAARKSLSNHFNRHHKALGQKQFDQYTTRTYNAYSTLDAQLTFCETSSRVGQDALFLSKGKLSDYATSSLPVVRASLIPSLSNPLYAYNLGGWVAVPRFVDPCPKKSLAKCK